MNDFLEKVKDLTDKGLTASKEMLGTAGEKVQDLSEKGVAKFEKVQLERQMQKQFTDLGKYVFEQIEKDEKKSLSFKDAEVTKINEEIVRLKEEIGKRENVN